jgi:hypothetical protein
MSPSCRAARSEADGPLPARAACASRLTTANAMSYTSANANDSLIGFMPFFSGLECFPYTTRVATTSYRSSPRGAFKIRRYHRFFMGLAFNSRNLLPHFADTLLPLTTRNVGEAKTSKINFCDAKNRACRFNGELVLYACHRERRFSVGNRRQH